MKRYVIIGMTALALSGCSVIQKLEATDVTKEVIAACGAITHALTILTLNKSKLSEKQINIVDGVVAASEPICGAEEPPASGLATVHTLLAQLTQVQLELMKGDN